MAIRKRRLPEEQENPDRWIVSYADFITLLFAFFVVMYAISSVNENKYRVLSQSLGNVFSSTDAKDVAATLKAVSASVKSNNNEHLLAQEAVKMTRIAQDVHDVMAPLVEQGKVRVVQNAQGVSIEINASLLFASGDAELNPQSTQALETVAQILKKDAHLLEVAGHTDNTPIATLFFPSNWELSAMRASRVARVLIAAGVAQDRITVLGHADTKPIADNTIEAERSKNRRVSITILSNLPQQNQELSLGG